MRIRNADYADRAAIASVHAASIRRLCAGHYSEDAIDAWVGMLEPCVYDQALAEKHVLVAEEDGALVGLGMLDAAAAIVSAVYVAPDHAGRGVGTAILAALEAEADRRGLDAVTAYATLNAQGFYARHGYERGCETYHALPNGTRLSCVEMVKRLEVGRLADLDHRPN